jgi:hypothetical protein
MNYTLKVTVSAFLAGLTLGGIGGILSGRTPRPATQFKYIYSSMGGVPVRINPETGAAHLLAGKQGWIELTKGDIGPKWEDTTPITDDRYEILSDVVGK